MEILIILLVIGVAFFVFRSISKSPKTLPSHDIPAKYFEDVVPHQEEPSGSYSFRSDIDFYGDFERSLTNEPHFAVFNLENDGKPLRYDASYKDLDNWPLPLRVEYYVFDGDQKLVFHKNVKLDRENDEGPDLYKEFLKDMRKCKVLVSHNVLYRLDILKADFLRNNIPFTLFKRDIICTMNDTAELVGIISKKGDYKWPKLTELVAACFFPEEDPEDFKPTEAVDFEWETRAMAKCFVALKNR